MGCRGQGFWGLFIDQEKTWLPECRLHDLKWLFRSLTKPLGLQLGCAADGFPVTRPTLGQPGQDFAAQEAPIVAVIAIAWVFDKLQTLCGCPSLDAGSAHLQ